MTLSKLVQEINNSNLSIEDLRILNELVVRNIKAQRKAQASANRVSLQEGMDVRVNHPSLRGQIGTIIKVKRVKATIEFNSGRYDVPMSIVEAA